MKRDVLILNDTTGELGKHTRVVRGHTCAKYLRQTGYLDRASVLLSIAMAQGFGESFSHRVTAAHRHGVDIALHFFRNGDRIVGYRAVDFKRRSKDQRLQRLFHGIRQHGFCTAIHRVDGLYRLVYKILGSRWSGEMKDIIHCNGGHEGSVVRRKIIDIIAKLVAFCTQHASGLGHIADDGYHFCTNTQQTFHCQTAQKARRSGYANRRSDQR